MTTKSRLLLGLLMATPGLAHALGLGDIRLGSALNQPLVAEIELVGATPDELNQLRAGLASRESFDRYGIDRPQSLSSLTFKVTKDAAGRNVLEVRSTDAMTEPFLTFLVEVSWPRGRLIREYTVLLDPPVFEQKPTQAPPVAAPRTGETTAPAAGAVTRTPAPAPVAEPAAPAPSAPATAGGEYRVVSGDTLSGIARRQGASGTSEVNRLMIAIYRANPGAFDGNINRLQRGSVLRIPGASDVEGLSSGEAAAEVRRQMAEWKGAGGGAAANEGARLKLVTPKEPVDGVGTGPAPAPAPAPAAAAKPGAADQKAADAKRLLELKNEGLARMQQQPGATPAPAPAPAATPVPAPAATPAAGPAAQAPAAAEPPPVEAPKPKAVKKPTPPPAEEPGFLDSLLGDNLMYVALGGAVLALLGLLGFRTMKRRRESVTDDTFRTLDRTPPADDALAGLSSTSRIPRQDAERTNILVEESDDDSGEFEAPPLAPAAAAPRTALRAAQEPRTTEDTLSSETALNLEQADPLAEADFHMAYGLYDQAADIVKLAINREPDRRDLQLKLLEVYFVWGNKDAFLDVARELGRTRDQAAAGEWEKVVIMGRQIAADDPLFAGETGRATDVDLDLDAGGAGGVDLELLGDDESQAMPARRAQGSDVDLDLGQALGSSLDDTGEARGLDGGLDLMLDDARVSARDATVEQPTLRAGNTTREMAPRLDAPTVEQPGLDDAFEFNESPTVESPALSGNTIREKIDSALFSREKSGVTGDATAELSLDDLGFDVEKLNATSNSIEALSVTDHPADAPTMVAGLDDRSRAVLRAAEDKAAGLDLAPTRELPQALGNDDATQLAPAYSRPAPEETGTVKALGAGDLDLDLDELARALENDTIEQPRRDEIGFSSEVFGGAKPNGKANGVAHADVDLDLGAPSSLADREPTVTERINTDDLALPELEPVTLSEVGTKLDLARAYMDMGDPDGARSILQEVLGEGSASQKQEAQRLIETLPG